MKSEVLRVTHELQAMKDKIKENSEKIKVNKTLPYLVSNVIEVRVVSSYVVTCKCVQLIVAGRKAGNSSGIQDLKYSQMLPEPGLPGFSVGFTCDLEVHVSCPLVLWVVP